VISGFYEALLEPGRSLVFGGGKAWKRVVELGATRKIQFNGTAGGPRLTNTPPCLTSAGG